MKNLAAYMLAAGCRLGDSLKRNLGFCKEAGVESIPSAWADCELKFLRNISC